MTNFVPLLSSCVIFMACGPGLVDDLEGSDERESTIYNGKLDRGHPAVGQVEESSCTGTLIGRKTVLTAAHCLASSKIGTFILGGKTYTGTAVVNPEWIRGPATHDLALIRLGKAVSGVKPRPLCTHPPDVGQLIGMVGYGRNDHPSYPNRTKLKGTNTISNVGTNALYIRGLGPNQSQGCFGDSGGPALVGDDCVAGAFSWIWWIGGYQMKCRERSVYSRVDIDRAWINAAARDSTVRWKVPQCRYANAAPPVLSATGCYGLRITTISASTDRLNLGCSDDEGRRRSGNIRATPGIFVAGGGCPSGTQVTGISANGRGLNLDCRDDEGRRRSGVISLQKYWAASGKCDGSLVGLSAAGNTLRLTCHDGDRMRSGTITITNAQTCP